MAQALPRFRQALEKIEDTKKLSKILIEAAAEAPPTLWAGCIARAPYGHNHARRRGLPLISKASPAPPRPGRTRSARCSPRKPAASSGSASFGGPGRRSCSRAR